MKRTIGIIGTGFVGTSIAVSLLHSGAADEVVLHDVNGERAEGEAMDLAHGAPFYPAAQVRTGSIEEMVDADVVVVSAGRGGKPGESRLDLLKSNVSIVREIGRTLSASRGILVVVSNPVDVLTYAMAEASGLPPERVIGTGTMLDTARLRQTLGQELSLDPRSVHAQVVGEHGDSEVVLWSEAHIGGVPLSRWPGWDPSREEEIGAAVRTAAYEIIKRKGATNHAIGLVTAALVRGILRGERRVLTVSRVQHGAMGMRDVALSLPVVVGADGAAQVVEPEMSPREREGLERSAEVLRTAIDSIR